VTTQAKATTWLSDKLYALSVNKPSITCRICSFGITEETYAVVDVS